MAVGDPFDSPPASPIHSPRILSNALMQYARGRRGRTLIASAVFAVVLLGLLIQSSSESLSYSSLSSYRLPSWKPSWPGMPFKSSPLLTPSNMTLELEAGDITNVPSQLKKSNPSFHLLMPASHDNADFCKATLSAMLLNYPPPTIIGYERQYEKQDDVERAKLEGIHAYLNSTKHVMDDDLILIVDGYDVWFQLPSDVMIKQYQNVLGAANRRLMEKYGFTDPKVTGKPARQKFSQTIVFGADKVCRAQRELSPCELAPESSLPDDIYGRDTGKNATMRRAKYLNAGTIMGPAKDLRHLFQVAAPRIQDQTIFPSTAQSVLAAIYGEQQSARDYQRKNTKTSTPAWRDWLAGKLGQSFKREERNVTLLPHHRYEYHIGLDYTHTLFQPFTYAALDELVPLTHDNITDLSDYHHKNTPTPPLVLPPALFETEPPFYKPGPESNPSPNEKPAYIVPLNYKASIDDIPPSNTSWENLNLITNTYTGAVPVLLHVNSPPPAPTPKSQTRKVPRAYLADLISTPSLNPSAVVPTSTTEPTARSLSTVNLTFSSLWFRPHSRALLRRYLRSPQSPIGFHAAAVGGDTIWDQRGGQGGVWTESGLWLEWGDEESGVCGSMDMVERVFGDRKGQWLHEVDSEEERQKQKQEAEVRKMLMEEEEKRRKEGVERKKEEAKLKMEEEARKKQQEEEEKELEEEAKKQEAEIKEKLKAELKAEEEEKLKIEQEQGTTQVIDDVWIEKIEEAKNETPAPAAGKVETAPDPGHELDETAWEKIRLEAEEKFKQDHGDVNGEVRDKQKDEVPA